MATRIISAAREQTNGFGRMAPGLLLSATVAVAAMQLGGIDWFTTHGLSALTVAIVLGMLIGNTVYSRIGTRVGAGVSFSKQTLLRAGVVLYGLRLTLSDVGQVGLAGVLIDALMLSSTLVLAIVVGTRLLKIDRDTAILIGAGSAICGAAAVMATEPVLRAKPERVTLAVATVVVFGTLAIFLYPALYSMNRQLGIVPAGEWFFGIYAGSTIQEVAQVVAAARSIGPDASDAAVIAKMVRVMMLAPFLIGLSVWLGRHAVATAALGTRRMAVPWFALGFIAMVGFNSLAVLPHFVTDAGIKIDTFLLAMAMAALGLTTHASAIRNAGARPLILAASLCVWLVVGGALINYLVLVRN